MADSTANLNSSPQTVTAPQQQAVRPAQAENVKPVGSTFDSDKVQQQVPLQINTIPTVTKNLKTPNFITEDTLTYGPSLEGNAAVEAYKDQIRNDQSNKKIGNAQESEALRNAKSELESQGWVFMKKLDEDCLYVGNNFQTGQMGYGLTSDGLLVDFSQNENFAYLG